MLHLHGIPSSSQAEWNSFNSLFAFLSKTPHQQDEMCTSPPKIITHDVINMDICSNLVKTCVWINKKTSRQTKAEGGKKQWTSAVVMLEKAFCSWTALLLVPQKSHFTEERLTGIPSGHILTVLLWSKMNAYSYRFPGTPPTLPTISWTLHAPWAPKFLFNDSYQAGEGGACNWNL